MLGNVVTRFVDASTLMKTRRTDPQKGHTYASGDFKTISARFSHVVFDRFDYLHNFVDNQRVRRRSDVHFGEIRALTRARSEWTGQMQRS
jgi:hypothetical protein